MTLQEAKEECARWFAHLERQREKTRAMQMAAALARSGDVKTAKRMRDKVDRMPRVYDGSDLERAVRTLLEVL